MFYSRQSSAPADNLSAEDLSSKINRLKVEIDTADAIIIGAGAGLSTSAGFTYDGERFKKYFSDFEEKYGFHDMYSGGFYPYDTQEEYWAYWSRHIWLNRYIDAPKPVYDDLLSIVRGKDYFVITTNVDHCFQKSGFEKERLFYTQGDYGLFQCSIPCRQETHDNEEMVRLMIDSQKDMRIPSELVPYCPHCGKPMTMNLRVDNKFVEDEGWHKAAKRYERFVEDHKHANILLLELGVGFNTPVIIKYPFWQMTASSSHVTYACVNFSDTRVPREIADKSICISMDIGDVLNRIKTSAI